MKKNHQRLVLFILIAFLSVNFIASVGARDIYQIKIYKLDNDQQEQRMDKYLQNAYIPALHRAGIKHVGVFKSIGEEGESGRSIFVLIPFKSIDQFEQLDEILQKDKKYNKDGGNYINAAHNDPPYARIESILLRAFDSMPAYGVPAHSTPPSERIYELRSYQGATEKLYRKKVEMFNEGGESKIFMHLGFQPVFFGEVISGPIMPNLMYMTTFENKTSQEEHWKSFINSPEWETLKSDQQYNNTVSKIDKYFLFPADYSEL